MTLKNLNSPNSFAIESYSTMLTSGLTFSVVDNKVFLNLNDNKFCHIEVTYNIPLENQIFSLFELAKIVKNVYKSKDIKRGLFKNENYAHLFNKSFYYTAPVFLKSNHIMDYFLIKTNCEIESCDVCGKCGNCDKCKCKNGEVKFGFDFKNHPFRKLLFNYLLKAESKARQVVEKNNSIIDLYNLNGLDFTTGQFSSTFCTLRQTQGTSLNICSTNGSSTHFDSQFADHSDFFYLLPKDKILIPSVISLDFYFDDELDTLTTQGIYYRETGSQKFDFDIASINQIFEVNIDLQRNGLSNDLFDTSKYNNNIWNTTTEIIAPKSKTDELIFKDRNGVISGAKYDLKNIVKINFNQPIDFNNILGVIHRQNPGYNPIHYVYDENYSNIKLNLNRRFNINDKIILKNEAHKLEIIGIAVENGCCNEFLECVNYSDSYTQTFIPSEIIQERTLLKVVVPKLVILKNYDNIDVRIGVDRFKAKIYNVRFNKKENETIFNIHIENFPRQLLQTQVWEFTYIMPKIYYFTFNPNQQNIDVLNEISDELNKIGLTNSFVDKDSLIIIRKSYEFQLGIITQNMDITLNDHPFRQHIVENNNNRQKFNYNHTEFSGNTENKNLIIFVPTVNDLILNKNTIAQIDGVNYGLSSYTLYDDITDYYTNFYLNNVLYPDYKGLVILNYNDEYHRQIVNFYELFQPKLYSLEIF